MINMIRSELCMKFIRCTGFLQFMALAVASLPLNAQEECGSVLTGPQAIQEY